MVSSGQIAGVIVSVLRRKASVVEVLFLQCSGGKYKGEWWPVAGTCEPDEMAVQTVIRELKEETGLEPLEVYELGKPVPHIDGASKLEGFVVYVSTDLQVTLNYEHTDYRWLTSKQAAEVVPASAKSFILYLEQAFMCKQPTKKALAL